MRFAALLAALLLAAPASAIRPGECQVINGTLVCLPCPDPNPAAPPPPACPAVQDVPVDNPLALAAAAVAIAGVAARRLRRS